MTILALDVGIRRIGIAISDFNEQFALPLKTITLPKNTLNFDNLDFDYINMQLAEIFTEYEIEKIIIGLPINLKGEYTKSTHNVLTFKKKLQEKFEKDFILYDERLSTNISLKQISSLGINKKKKKEIVDQLAAKEILDNWLRVNESKKR